MKTSNHRLSPKQVEDILQVSKSQLHHWEKMLDLKPLERSYGRGLATVYSRDNLFVLLLLKRLFKEFRFTLSAAVSMVQRLLRDVGLERLQELPSCPVPTFAIDTADLPQPRTRRLGRPARQRHRINTKRPAIVGTLTIPLKDLQEVSNGPLN